MEKLIVLAFIIMIIASLGIIKDVKRPREGGQKAGSPRKHAHGTAHARTHTHRLHGARDSQVTETLAGPAGY